MAQEGGWKLKDLFLVSIIVILLSCLMIPVGNIVFHSDRIGKYLFLFTANLLSSVIPVLWIRKYYNLREEKLGIRIGRWSLKFTILVGISVGAIFFLIELLISGKISLINRFSLSNVLPSFLLLLSADGLLMVIFAPISEEIYYRGFLYGYLRPRLGQKFSLIIQALIFGFLHFTPTVPIPTFSFGQIFWAFIVGVLCGVLYETSGSLYPSMIYHATLSYFTLTFWIRKLSPLGAD